MLWLVTIGPCLLLAWWLWAQPHAWTHGHTLDQRSEALTTLRPMAFSPDGKTLAAGFDGLVRLLSVDELESKTLRTGTDEDSSSAISSLAWSPDGKTLAACSEGGWWVWQIETGEILHESRSPCRLFVVAVGPDSNTFICGNAGRLHLWQRNRQEEKVLDLGISYVAPATEARFSGGGSLVAIGTEQTVSVYDLSAGTLRYLVGGQATTSLAPIQSSGSFRPGWGDPLDFAFDKGQLVVLHGRAYDAKIIPLSQTRSRRKGEITGKSAVVGYDLASGGVLWTRPIDVGGQGGSLGPNGRFAAIVEYTPYVSLFEISSGKKRWRRKIPSNEDSPSPPLVWSPEGGLLAVSRLRMWSDLARALVFDVQTGRKIGTLNTKDGNFRWMSLTENGEELATMADQRLVRLWRRGKQSDGFLDFWQGWAILALGGLFGLAAPLHALKHAGRKNVRGPGIALSAMAVGVSLAAVGGAAFHAAWFTRQSGSWDLRWGQANFWEVIAGPGLLTLHVLIVSQVLTCRNFWRWLAVLEACVAIWVTVSVTSTMIVEQQYELVQSFTYNRNEFLIYWTWVLVGLLGPWLVWLVMLLYSSRRFAFVRLWKKRQAQEPGPASQGTEAPPAGSG